LKYLITGLGNIGDKYYNTRHNIGFSVLDAFVGASNIIFEDKRYGNKAVVKHKGRTFVLIKPSTFVNLSGKAVNYWLKKEKIPVENLLIIADDIALPFGKLRLRPKGGCAGHNGLTSIIETLGNNKFARLRFGIGNEFNRGGQVDYVLGQWTEEEKNILPEHINKTIEIIKSFSTIGLEQTMNIFN